MTSPEMGTAIYLDYVERATGLRITLEQWRVIKFLAGAEKHSLARACAPYDRTGRAMFLLNYAAARNDRGRSAGLVAPDGMRGNSVLEAYVEAQSRLRRDWGAVTVETVLTVEYLAAVGIRSAVERAVEEARTQSVRTAPVFSPVQAVTAASAATVEVAVNAAVEAERRRIAGLVRGLSADALSGHPAGSYVNIIVGKSRNAIADVIENASGHDLAAARASQPPSRFLRA